VHCYYRQLFFNAEFSPAERSVFSVAMRQLMSSALQRDVPRLTRDSHDSVLQIGQVYDHCAAMQHWAGSTSGCMPSTSTNAIKHSQALAQRLTSQARFVAENRLCSSPRNRVIEAVCSVHASLPYNYTSAFYT